MLQVIKIMVNRAKGNRVELLLPATVFTTWLEMGLTNVKGNDELLVSSMDIASNAGHLPSCTVALNLCLVAPLPLQPLLRIITSTIHAQMYSQHGWTV